MKGNMYESAYRKIASYRTDMSVCEQFHKWATEAVEQWDGVCNVELIEAIRVKFGQSREQFYGGLLRAFGINHEWKDNPCS